MKNNLFLNLAVAVGVTFASMNVRANDAAWVDDLTNLNLQTADLTNPTPQDVIQSLSRGVAPSTEGLPGHGDEAQLDDILDSAYTTSSLINRALDDARMLPMGQRIQHFESSVLQILKKSGQNPMETRVRITLNRSVDVANNVIKIAGNNPELISQWLANFYKTSFELAAAYANNPKILVTANENGDVKNDVGQFVQQESLAQFGFTFSTLLWRNQANMTSDSSKAVILIKMLGFIGYDFNNDPRRREQSLKEVIADVYRLQNQDMNYKNIIASLKAGQEPKSQDVAALRVKVYKVWTGLPAKLSQANIKTAPVTR